MTIEELQEQLVDLQEKFKSVEAEKSNLSNKVEELEKSNKTLLETNNKLFMRVTEERNTPDKTPEEINKDLTQEEQEELLIKDILEIIHPENKGE